MSRQEAPPGAASKPPAGRSTLGDAVVSAEPRRLALQAVVEIDRGLTVADGELRAGWFMDARDTTATVRALLPLLEGAIQRIGCPERTNPEETP